jgi:predicted RNase H-like HicB family nuclease
VGDAEDSLRRSAVDVIPSVCRSLTREDVMKLKVLLRAETKGGYSVSVPALPGCFSQGETREEALSNIREAAELWLEVSADEAEAQGTDAEFQEIEL